jgi:hypothetical protein
MGEENGFINTHLQPITRDKLRYSWSTGIPAPAT